MGVREVIREWRRGCVNTIYPGRPFWVCGHCARAAVKAMLRAAAAGRM